MSRFLDALRDSGEQSLDGDKKSRGYKGQIVDVDDVLGADTDHTEAQGSDQNKQHAEDDADTSSALADGGDDGWQYKEDDTDVAEQLSLQDDGTDDAGVVPNSVTTNLTGPDKKSSTPYSAESAVPTGDGLPHDSIDRQALPRQGIFTSRSLDPLFYLIVGVAALGLFGSLYALITQNDAYFEREYQQLQKESAALQARLAAVATPVATPVASNDVPVAQQQPAIDSTIADDSQLPEVGLQAGGADALVQGVSEVDIADQAAQLLVAQMVKAEESANSTAIAILKQEVDDLRSQVSMQEKKISRIEQEKLALVRQLDEHSKHAQPVVAVTSDIKIEPAVMSDASVAATGEMPDKPRPAPSLNQPQASSDSDIASMIGRAYLAYQAADYVTAGELYGDALQFDPYHRDANLGVAAVAQINGEIQLAEHRYRHLLTLDPSDAVAFSALINLAARSDASSSIEFELIQHVRYVDDPHQLYSILGNYFSQQQRWFDAEQAYAVAIAGDEENADYLYNYAVSLDNLGRTAEAAGYYSKALVYAVNGAYSFQISAVEQRLQSIGTLKP